MLKSLGQFTRPIRTYVWGVTTNHPNYRETRLAIGWPMRVALRETVRGFGIEVTFYVPKIHVLNAFELEADYMSRGSHA